MQLRSAGQSPSPGSPPQTGRLHQRECPKGQTCELKDVTFIVRAGENTFVAEGFGCSCVPRGAAVGQPLRLRRRIRDEGPRWTGPARHHRTSSVSRPASARRKRPAPGRRTSSRPTWRPRFGTSASARRNSRLFPGTASGASRARVVPRAATATAGAPHSGLSRRIGTTNRHDPVKSGSKRQLAVLPQMVRAICPG